MNKKQNKKKSNVAAAISEIRSGNKTVAYLEKSFVWCSYFELNEKFH